MGGRRVERRRRKDRAAEGRENGTVWGGGPLPVGDGSRKGVVPPPQKIFSNFDLKMVSCGAFWVVFYVIESYF